MRVFFPPIPKNSIFWTLSTGTERAGATALLTNTSRIDALLALRVMITVSSPVPPLMVITAGSASEASALLTVHTPRPSVAATSTSSRARDRGFTKSKMSRGTKERSLTTAFGSPRPNSVHATPGAGAIARDTPVAPPTRSTA